MVFEFLLTDEIFFLLEMDEKF